jgi:hypothetical protein
VKRTTILAILFAIVIAVSCKKENTTPQPPVITFLDAQFSADKSASIVSFEFFDEDGDLGLQQEENKGEQQYNVFVDYYEKENGLWILKSPIIAKIPDLNEPSGFRSDTTITHLRFPFLENNDGSSLTGEAQIELFYNNFIQPLADTFRYEIYINDRAFQKSNTIITAEMVVN